MTNKVTWYDNPAILAKAKRMTLNDLLGVRAGKIHAARRKIYETVSDELKKLAQLEMTCTNCASEYTVQEGENLRCKECGEVFPLKLTKLEEIMQGGENQK